MTEKMDNFAARCKKLPGRLKQWDAFTQLRLARAANVASPKDHTVWTKAANPPPPPPMSTPKIDFRLARTRPIG